MSSDEVYRLEIEVPPGRTFRGVVLEASTRTPIAGAEISDNWTFRRSAVTGADGQFELGGVKTSTHTEIHVRAAGFASQATTKPGSKDEELEFLLVRGASITGRFVTSDASPIGS